MIVHFTLIPLGNNRGDSLSKSLAQAMKHVVNSGLNYKVSPMGTVVEGEWGPIIRLIDRCRKALRKNHPRVNIFISIDDRKNARGQITGKVRSLEKKMRLRLNQ